jgi:hypothetical protein
MKKIKLIFLALLISAVSFAQVGIGTITPTAGSILELKATDKALLITRVANTAAVTTPVNGMIIYDLSVDCFKGYQNNAWTDCGFLFVSPSSNGSALVSAYSCSTATAGTLITGVPVYSVTQTITATVTTLGTYNIVTPTVNGVYFSATGTFAGTGAQNIVLTATGTPTAAGTNSFTLNTSPNCSFSRTTANPAVAPTNAIGAGSLSGKTCFDVAISNDNANGCGLLSGRIAQKSDFTLTATNTQTYTFTPSGTVSNVRFVYVNTNGNAITSLTGGNAGNSISTAVTATVTYANTLNSPATGLTSSNPITSNIYVVYNNSANNTGSDLQLKLTANIKDCACCGAYVSATNFKEFLCHNLGANTSLDPNIGNVGLNGAYVQWGKRGPNITGDSRIDWQTAPNNGLLGFVAAPTISDPNTAAIVGWNQTNPSANAWNSGTEMVPIKTSNDPCPTGYRVPTLAEWTGVKINNTAITIGTWSASATPIYNSMKQFGPSLSSPTLSLPAAGYRAQNDGRALLNFDQGGQYQSSTAVAGNQTGSDYYVGLLGFSQTTVNTSPDAYLFGYRTQAYTVRCIAE